MKKIEHLIEQLNIAARQGSIESLANTLKAESLTLSDLPSAPQFDDYCYNRSVIHSNEDYELMLLTWKPGQKSPIHNHKGSACVVQVISGVASEILFSRSSTGMIFPSNTAHYPTGSICASYDEETHLIVNLGEENLVTLHLYTPPLANMEVFSLAYSPFSNYDLTVLASTRKSHQLVPLGQAA